MRRQLTLAALIVAAPLAAQAPPPTNPGAGSAMMHSGMSSTDHEAKCRQAAAMSAVDPGKMQAMDHGNMAGMMTNTPANPYAEAGMMMHHSMMVVGADASETWVRQMIEHHRGAITISKIAVAQATDTDVRAMAQKDIARQEKDIASLQTWLKRSGLAVQ